MKITFATEHQWIKPITEDPLSELGNSNKSRVRSTIQKISDMPVTHVVEPLTEKTLEWFTPLYNKTISGKDNAKIFDIYNTTLGKKSEFKYYALTLYENNKPVGATIFSERKTLISIAYRIYPNRWNSCILQANPSIYTEYLINVYGRKQGFVKLSHGKDRNPYGINSQIGLAIFKLSVGCKAYLPYTEYETATIDTDTLTKDVLILEHPSDERQIKKGYLVTLEKNLEKNQQAIKYPEHLDVTVIIRE